jgi:hypothetical protein
VVEKSEMGKTKLCSFATVIYVVIQDSEVKYNVEPVDYPYPTSLCSSLLGSENDKQKGSTLSSMEDFLVQPYGNLQARVLTSDYVCGMLDVIGDDFGVMGPVSSERRRHATAN